MQLISYFAVQNCTSQLISESEKITEKLENAKRILTTRNFSINIYWIWLKYRFWEIQKGRWAERLVNWHSNKRLKENRTKRKIGGK